MVLYDNLGAVATSQINKITLGARRLGVILCHARSLFENNVVDVKYIATNLQKVDILTKSLGGLKLGLSRLILLGE